MRMVSVRWEKGKSMYKSPIRVIYGQMQTKMEGDVLKAVQSYHINVDRDELIRALKYDRDQYKKGYADATPKWIPVTERLPEKRTFVLGVTAEFVCECIMLEDKQFWLVNTDDGDGEIEVTHWMPLPEPPKGE